MGSNTAASLANPFSKTRFAPVPGQTPEERELMAEQVKALRQQQDLLNRQLKEMDLISGMAFERSGMRMKRDPTTGEVTGIEEIPDAELRPELRRQREIQRLQEERSLAALKGELPTDPGLTRELETGQRSLEDRLLRELGPGFRTSTPGIEALATGEQRRNEILDMARRGDLSLAEQLSQARQASTLSGTQQSVAELFGPTSRFSTPFQQSGQLAAGFSGPLSTLLQGRGLEAQVNVANMQQWLNRRKAVAQTFTSIFGAGSVMGGK